MRHLKTSLIPIAAAALLLPLAGWSNHGGTTLVPAAAPSAAVANAAGGDQILRGIALGDSIDQAEAALQQQGLPYRSEAGRLIVERLPEELQVGALVEVDGEVVLQLADRRVTAITARLTAGDDPVFFFDELAVRMGERNGRQADLDRRWLVDEWGAVTSWPADRYDWVPVADGLEPAMVAEWNGDRHERLELARGTIVMSVTAS